MKTKLETKISVTYYLKKVSLKKEVKKKAVYATIAFKGTVAKMSTGIKCENSEKDWKSGMFERKTSLMRSMSYSLLGEKLNLMVLAFSRVLIIKSCV